MPAGDVKSAVAAAGEFIDVLGIFSGRDILVSHPGTSQYAQGGVSACGLAALNAARVALTSTSSGEGLLAELSRWEKAEEILGICSLWTQSNLHLEVEDTYRVPLFEKSMLLVASPVGRPKFLQFQALLRRMQKSTPSNSPAAVVITRPPEILTCLRVPTSKGDAFVLFDSHPRHVHPDGAGFTFSASLDATANHLTDLLSVDEQILNDPSLQWQVQLLSQYSGHIFTARPSATDPGELTYTIMESSLTILALRAQIAAMKFEETVIISENKRLEAKMEHMEDTRRNDEQKLQSSKQTASVQASVRSRAVKGPNAIAGPSRPCKTHHAHPPSPPTVDYYFKATSWHKGNPSSIQSKPKHSFLEQGNFMVVDDSSDFLKPNSNGQSSESSLQYALRVQRELAEEGERLVQERRALSGMTQMTFECGVCLDEHAMDDLASVEGCNHSFCRSCMKSYISAKISVQRFPIPCPICVADQKRTSEPSMLSNLMVEGSGITEKEYETFVELQLAAFSILLHCRKCKQSVFVDRSEHQAARELTCPLPRCNYTWCKSCQRRIDFGGPRHSCDGSSELQALMDRRGWKACPGCKTPIQKESGCNHMTCAAPGCNVHFCYVCGQLIIRSAIARDIKIATTSHYQRCRLFEEVADRIVPL